MLSKTGSDYSAVAIRASRDKKHLPVVKESSTAKTNRDCRGTGAEDMEDATFRRQSKTEK